MRKILILFVLLGLLFPSCNKDNDLEKLRENELELLADFVGRYNQQHGTDIEPSLSGLYYVEVEEGTGDSIKVGDRVQIWYNTYLLRDTSLVDSNMEDGHKYSPLEFLVNTPGNSTVVEGINEAVKNMRPNGKAFLIVPSELAYGQDGSYSIPSFSTLLFDIEIYKVFRAEDN